MEEHFPFVIDAPIVLSDWVMEWKPMKLVYRPAKDRVPCWFHRKMQELCFGVKWRKVK